MYMRTSLNVMNKKSSKCSLFQKQSALGTSSKKKTQRQESFFEMSKSIVIFDGQALLKVETTWLECLVFSFPPLISPQRRKKEIKQNMSLFFLENKQPYRKPVHGLIPINQGINHSPPYLLGVTQLESNRQKT